MIFFFFSFFEGEDLDIRRDVVLKLRVWGEGG